MLLRPNWKYWTNLVDVKLRDAAALSCDISPDSIEGELPLTSENLAATSEIHGRFEIAHSHAVEGILPVRRRVDAGGQEREFVRLADFRAWGESLSPPFDFPEQFPAAALMAKKATTQSASSKTDNPLRADTRRNWLRIIRALYEKANLEERDAAGTIEKMIEALGFDGPKDDTIREVLREARSLPQDHKPR